MGRQAFFCRRRSTHVFTAVTRLATPVGSCNTSVRAGGRSAGPRAGRRQAAGEPGGLDCAARGRAGGMAKKRSKAARRGDALKLRMTQTLARHGLTIDQAGRLSDADLRRRRGIGRTMIAVIRSAGDPAAPPSPTSDAAVTEPPSDARDKRIATLERQVAELLEAVRVIAGSRARAGR